MGEPLDFGAPIELPASADLHVHLRDGALMKTVVPTIRQGGVDLVMVMPNLVPPITTVARALEYQKELQAIEPEVTYLMSLYLHPSITPEVIKEAASNNVRNVKSYPAGVTTNSSAGVVDYEPFYPVFAEMERQGLILNLHGESPSGKGISVLNAEESFLPKLKELHGKFPDLRIVLEHCTTSAAIEAVKQCGPTVAGTITAHHLSLTVDDWAGDPHCFCKPVAKTPEDRAALLRAAASNDPKFFLGTDSAPHPAVSKRGGPTGMGKNAAGVFTQPYATQYVIRAFQTGIDEGILFREDVTLDALKNFLGIAGRKFYKVSESGSRITVSAQAKTTITELLRGPDGVEVVPFLRGTKVKQVEWA